MEHLAKLELIALNVQEFNGSADVAIQDIERWQKLSAYRKQMRFDRSKSIGATSANHESLMNTGSWFAPESFHWSRQGELRVLP